MNHKDQIVLTPDARRAIAAVELDMIKNASLDLKNIFAGLGMKMPKIRTTKNPSFTKKGPGRYRPNVKEIVARLEAKSPEKVSE